MIYILGGRGYVGSAFVRLCEKAGRPHTVITRDNYAQHAGSSCDVFVNANGNSKKFLSAKEPMTDFDASVRSVRQTLVDFRAETYIHLSSCDVYPDCTTPETTREDATEPVAGGPAAQSPYGFHKYLAELCVRHAHPRHLVLRMGGFVGPGMKKNAIFDILTGSPLWLDPESQLQFMRTDELARIAMALADESGDDHVNRVYNVCGRGVVRLRDIVTWAAGAGLAGDIEVKPDAPKVQYEVSIERISEQFDITPSVDAVRAFVESDVAAEIAREAKTGAGA